jgi:putative two-component system response regulator
MQSTQLSIISQHPTILIVEDNEFNRELLQSIFENSYFVETAQNGEECLEKIHNLCVNTCALLLDVHMPVMDGMEVLEELALLDVPSWLPIFLITGENDSSVIYHAYDLGVMDVISKPFSSYVVQRRVNSIIELYRARKKLSSTIAQQKHTLIQQTSRILDLNRGLVEALATAIEFRSCESGEHIRHVHDITELLLRHCPMDIRFSDENIKQIALAAIIHDVGKVTIPDAILNKPGGLTPQEFELMKQHTVQGEYMLQNIPQMKDMPFFHYACDIVRHHHERWDGYGYPDGLKGDEISIPAQVVALADVYDALVSKRVYKDALDFDTAKNLILSGKCGTFNPKILKCFLSAEPLIRSFYIH